MGDVPLWRQWYGFPELCGTGCEGVKRVISILELYMYLRVEGEVEISSREGCLEVG